jgi:hypothetical protein
VSRRGPEVLDLTGLKPTERKDKIVKIPTPPDVKTERGDEGLVIYLKINYKVVLLVVTMFDLLHTSINEMVSHFFGI